MKREPGFYWVYYDGWTTKRWEVWEWDGKDWREPGNEQQQSEPRIIGDRILPPIIPQIFNDEK